MQAGLASSPLSALQLPVLLLLLLAPSALDATGGEAGGLHVHDSAHMFAHMDHLSIKPPSTDQMSESEQEYYYFKMHDFDNNNKLDGLEVLKSLVDHDAKESFSDQYLEQAINEVLKDEDSNGDGYIEYSEFVAAQRKADAGQK